MSLSFVPDRATIPVVSHDELTRQGVQRLVSAVEERNSVSAHSNGGAPSSRMASGWPGNRMGRRDWRRVLRSRTMKTALATSQTKAAARLEARRPCGLAGAEQAADTRRFFRQLCIWYWQRISTGSLTHTHSIGQLVSMGRDRVHRAQAWYKLEGEYDSRGLTRMAYRHRSGRGGSCRSDSQHGSGYGASWSSAQALQP